MALMTRRGFVVSLTTIAGALGAAPARADALDAVAIDPAARILRKELISVPAPSGQGRNFGVIGADIFIPGRGFLGLDWSIQGRQEITLMLTTAQQKIALLAGRAPSGDPLMRLNIRGPETAGQGVPVAAGAYFVAFLNGGTSPVQLLYRASFQAF